MDGTDSEDVWKPTCPCTLAFSDWLQDFTLIFAQFSVPGPLRSF